jgi:putative transposase
MSLAPRIGLVNSGDCRGRSERTKGPEFTSRALDRWAYRQEIDLKLITAGRPTENAFIESFNGKFRDECLNDHYFTNLEHARAVISAWRRDYNENRPHSSLGRIPPAEFAARHRLKERERRENV